MSSKKQYSELQEVVFRFYNDKKLDALVICKHNEEVKGRTKNQLTVWCVNNVKLTLIQELREADIVVTMPENLCS